MTIKTIKLHSRKQTATIEISKTDMSTIAAAMTQALSSTKGSRKADLNTIQKRFESLFLDVTYSGMQKEYTRERKRTVKSKVKGKK